MKNTIKLLEAEVNITHNGKTITNYEGDPILIKLIKPVFTEEIRVSYGDSKDTKEGTLFNEYAKILKPGDKGYIEAILMLKIRNEMGMEIE